MASEAPPFGRVVTAMATPFHADGSVDLGEAGRLAQYLAGHGSDGLVVAGSTGESVTLSVDEKLSLFQTVRSAVGKEIKVLAGVGSSSTAETVKLIGQTAGFDLDGLLVVTPAYNKPSQSGLYQHFVAAAEAAESRPVMLYNVPSRTGVNLEAQTAIRLAEISNVVALKEAGRLEQAGEVVVGAPTGFAVYSGADEFNLPILALGGVGVVSVISHVVGQDLQKMCQAFFSGDIETARALHLRTMPMTKAMFCAPNPVPTKTALVALGVITDSRVRLPLVDANERECALIRTALIEYGLL